MGSGNVGGVDRLLVGLTDDQQRAVTTAAPRLRILAGAGSGKTRVLTRRIAYQTALGEHDARHTLALTFTRKAAGELRHRLAGLGLHDDVTAGTFHAHAYAMLRSRWKDQDIRAPKLLDRRGRVLGRVLPRTLERSDRLAVQQEIDWATARRISPDTYVEAAERANRRRIVVPAAQVAEHYRSFVERKRQQKLVDFDDLLELSIRAMADPSYAPTQHWRFRHLFVDEFQDVNPLQYAALRSWLGPEATLCVVGDPNQAIYSWNGADAGYLQRFDEHFPGGQTVELRRNFRSTPQILSAAAAVQGHAGRLEPNRPDGPLPTVHRYDDDRAEALGIARTVRDSHPPGGRWSHQAVLVRTNAQTALIADALRQRGIPVAIRGGSNLLDDARVKERLNQLDGSRAALRSVATDLRVEAEADLDADVAPPAGELTPDHAAALLALAEDQLTLDPAATAADFVTWVRATLAGGADDATDAVEVVTFHASKGLEWPIVHLAGVEDGLVPISHATTPDALAEERRLFYVAVTRAEDRLHCSWAQRRTFGERQVDRSPSVFLRDIATVTDDATPPTERAADNISRVRALREQLGVQEATPDQRRAALREWRTSTARANEVPAYVVFNDATLDALVDHAPTTHEALADIPGIGPVKLDRWGDELLRVLAEAASIST